MKELKLWCLITFGLQEKEIVSVVKNVNLLVQHVFLSVSVYLGNETTQSVSLGY